MRVGLFKRSASFILDIMPIIMIVMLLQQWFIGGIIKTSIDPNYDQLEVEYFELLEERDAEIEPYYQQYEDGEITVEQFESFRDPINNAFLEDNTELINTVIIQYWLYAIMYWIISTNLIYMIYVLAFKGQTSDFLSLPKVMIFSFFNCNYIFIFVNFLSNGQLY